MAERAIRYEKVPIIVKIMMTDPPFMESKRRFYDALRLPPVEYFDIEIRSRFVGSPSYEFFSTVLTKWITTEGNNATLERLERILMEEGFANLAEKIKKIPLTENVDQGVDPNLLLANVAKTQTKVPLELFRKQMEFVQSKFPELMAFTRDWDRMAVQLQATGLLSVPSIEKLRGKSNDTERFHEMYNEIMRKRNFFETLKECLKNSGNDDAFEVLEEFGP